jgi:2-polyprenyl-3-methyl-5-hydroxy-6-metoxy-1,4-benzoquinol methylase
VSAAAEDWPVAGLEFLGSCPVCGSADRDILYAGLEDRLYNAPGKWNLYSCGNCRSSYLDPRPSIETIQIAYGQYHTHTEQSVLPASELHGLRRLKRVLANGYKNWKFGTSLEPSSRFGILAAFLLPAQRAILDRQYRHLPRRQQRGRLLDIGFGDAGFLENAHAAGWSVVGTDMDPTVVQNARARGFDARLGTVDVVRGPFDAITMSHVIEHLHDPVAVLRTCYELLSPGGTLWVETPNIDANGRRRLGSDWRGLEPPRHLVLFSRASLMQIVRGIGFTDVHDLAQASAVPGMYVASAPVPAGCHPWQPARLPLKFKLEVITVSAFEWVVPSKREFVAITARKPPIASGRRKSLRPAAVECD